MCCGLAESVRRGRGSARRGGGSARCAQRGGVLRAEGLSRGQQVVYNFGLYRDPLYNVLYGISIYVYYMYNGRVIPWSQHSHHSVLSRKNSESITYFVRRMCDFEVGGSLTVSLPERGGTYFVSLGSREVGEADVPSEGLRVRK